MKEPSEGNSPPTERLSALPAVSAVSAARVVPVVAVLVQEPPAEFSLLSAAEFLLLSAAEFSLLSAVVLAVAVDVFSAIRGAGSAVQASESFGVLSEV
jgi:hypothetical protein